MLISKKGPTVLALAALLSLRLYANEKSNPNILTDLASNPELQLVIKETYWATNFLRLQTFFGLKPLSDDRKRALIYYDSVYEKHINQLSIEIELLEKEIAHLKNGASGYGTVIKKCPSEASAATATVILAPWGIIESIFTRHEIKEKEERLSDMKKAKNLMGNRKNDIRYVLRKYA